MSEWVVFGWVGCSQVLWVGRMTVEWLDVALSDWLGLWVGWLIGRAGGCSGVLVSGLVDKDGS